MKFYYLRIFVFFLYVSGVYADTGVDSDLEQIYQGERAKYKPKGPYLTGPLLTSSAYTIPAGHYNIEPYFIKGDEIGFYSGDKLGKKQVKGHNINVQFICQLGLTEYVDITIAPIFVCGYSDIGKSYMGMGDVTIGPSFRILKDDKRFYDLTWKVGLNQVFPSGKSTGISPEFSGNDILGEGAWSTNLYTAASKLFHFYREQFLAARMAFSVVFFAPSDIKGLTVYGGDATTDGTVYRGTELVLAQGFEYTLNLNWALALDLEYEFSFPDRFKGRTVQPVGNDKNQFLFIIAPALEYNFNQDIGIIGGFWVSAYGVNSAAFWKSAVAVNWYF